MGAPANPRPRWLPLLLGPLAALLIWTLTDLDPGHPAITRMAGAAVWMALWWLTEAVPLATRPSTAAAPG